VKANILCAAAVVALALPGSARAQAPDTGVGAESAGSAGSQSWRAPRPALPGRAGSFEVTASVLWLAASSLGTSAANLTSNNLAGSPYQYFTASGEAEGAAGFEARASYNLTRMFAIDGGVTYSRPGLSFTIANDAEGAPGFTSPGETTSQFFVEASLVAYFSRYGFAGGRARPFVEIGAGHLRELHGQTTAASSYASLQTGHVYHAGGGVQYFFRSRSGGIVKGYGVRFGARLYVRNGGFTFDGRMPRTFAASGGLVAAF
jgi:hypothetical protein